MSHGHNTNLTLNNGCGCKKDNCPSCTKVFTVQTDCCNKCGEKSCDTKSCCSACGEGPEEVTNEELGSQCSWFWMSVWRNCCQQPIRVSPSRFRAFLLEGVNFNEYIDLGLFSEQITALINEQLGNVVTNSAFLTLSNKVNKNCSDISTINAFLSNLTIPPAFDPTGYATEAWVQNYTYSKVQITDLLEGIQNQVDTLTQQVADLQAQLDACDCGDGGGTGTTFTIPTVSGFENILTTTCPAATAAVITNPDGAEITVTVAGPGIVTITEDGSAVTSPFTPADQSVIEITVTSAAGTNAVGSVSFAYSDGGTNNGNLTGVTYDITCPEDTGGGDAIEIACGDSNVINHTGGNAGTYTGNVVVTNSTNYTLSLFGIDAPVDGYFVDNGNGLYALNFPSNYDTSFGPQNFIIVATDTDTGDTAQCDAGVITVTGDGPIN